MKRSPACLAAMLLLLLNPVQGRPEVPHSKSSTETVHSPQHPSTRLTSAKPILHDSGMVHLRNIMHQGRLWHANLDAAAITGIELLHDPAADPAFPFYTVLHFGNGGLTLKDRGQTSPVISALVAGTFCEIPVSGRATDKRRILRLRVASYGFPDGGRHENHGRYRLDFSRIDPGLYFLAIIEEMGRLSAFSYVEALREKHPEVADEPHFSRYTSLSAACSPNGILNLLRAVRPEFRSDVSKIAMPDGGRLPEWDRATAHRLIRSWMALERIATDGLRGSQIELGRFAGIAKVHRSLRSGNQSISAELGRLVIHWATGPAPQRNVTEMQHVMPAGLSDRQKAWHARAFSNPAHPLKRGSAFRFLVHGVTTRKSPSDVYTFLTEGLKERDDYVLSASVIGDKHTTFYGKAGFILEVPEGSIFAAGPDDIGTITTFRKPELLKRYIGMHFNDHGLPTPEELIASTAAENYNEIAILSPGITGKPLKITGIIISRNPGSAAGTLTAEDIEKFRELAIRLNLPIVEVD